jgi:hypothetical protein
VKRMSVREFKHSFHRVEEPIEVLRRTTTIGMYYPTGFGPKGIVGGDEDNDYHSIPGKYPPDHTMVPGRAPRSTG